MSTMNRLTGRVCLITGAESGIGLETARLFVAEGAKVHLVGIDAARLQAAAEELGSSAAATHADVTAKHAQVGLMRTAAKEAAARRIRVNTIHPGPTDTPFQRAIEVAATGAPEDRAAEIFEQMIPLRRHASPAEIARSVLYLACDD